MFGFGRPQRPRFVAFDAIGTVFPLAPLRPLVAALGLPPTAVASVYAIALRDSFALAAVGDYQPFKALFAAGLDEVLALHGLRAPSRARTAVLDGMRHLTARPDAGAAFQHLRRAGCGVGIVTNGALKDTRTLLDRTGLAPLVDLVVSAERVGLSKPRPEIYAAMAKAAGVKARHLALVACHPWDIHGAHAAGLATAFVSADHPFPRTMHAPDIEAPTLLSAAQALADR